MEKTIVTLSNGKKVGNFSSPHPFIFTDSSVLPAVSPEEAERLKITFIEKELTRGDVELTFDLSADVMIEMASWVELQMLREVDVVFCPLPMITAIRRLMPGHLQSSPFRAIRIEDRIHKLISINKQCL